MLVGKTTRSARHAGFGYLAGEVPDGLVKFEGVPGRAYLYLFQRGYDNNNWVRTVFSNPDGTYHIGPLPMGQAYNVVFRDQSETYADTVRGPVYPEAY